MVIFLGMVRSLLSQPAQQPKATVAHAPPPPFRVGPPPPTGPMLHRPALAPAVSCRCRPGTPPLVAAPGPLVLLHLHPPYRTPLPRLPSSLSAHRADPRFPPFSFTPVPNAAECSPSPRIPVAPSRPGSSVPPPPPHLPDAILLAPSTGGPRPLPNLHR
jgi:hypothetical protein